MWSNQKDLTSTHTHAHTQRRTYIGASTPKYTCCQLQFHRTNPSLKLQLSLEGEMFVTKHDLGRDTFYHFSA